MTKSVILTVTDCAEADELEEAQRLWEQQVTTLRRTLGAKSNIFISSSLTGKNGKIAKVRHRETTLFL